MNKTEFVHDITNRMKDNGYNNATLKETAGYIDALKACVYDALAAGDEVTIPSFVKFTVKDVDAHIARNPATGEPVSVPATKQVRIKALTELKNSVK